jgi:uncharacterized surface protein with fasciclin (FAS1) repeats
MKSIGLILILLGILGGATPISVAQDAAPPSVDLYSGQKQPKVTPTAVPESIAPDMPELSRLDESFKPRSLGNEADQLRLHVEWRQLANRVVNDPQVVAAKAAAKAARTDLEKRNRLRNYYNVYYGRMSALASSVELKVALEALKTAHQNSLNQPNVRPSPSTSPSTDALKVAGLNSPKQLNLPPSPSASSSTDASKVAGLNSLLKQSDEPPLPSASPALDISKAAPSTSPNQPAMGASPAPSAQAEPNADIIVAAKRTGQLNRFVIAMNFSRQASTLNENGPVTVFAPTDDAFAKAPPGTIDFPFNAEQIGKLLSYHMIKGAVTSNELTTRKARALNGATLDVKVVNGEITVNDAHVIKADVKASNGVIYIIDKVLVPPAG